jgi:type IV secretion system protein VirB1
MKLLGSSKPEAIQLATELVIAGHRVRVGLASLDTRDLDRLGVSLTDAFEPCRHLSAAARLMAENPGKLKPASPLAARAETHPGAKAPTRPELVPSPGSQPPPVRAWDVYGRGRVSSALVYGGSD